MRALIIYRDLLPALNTLDDASLGKLIRSSLALVTEGDDQPPDDPALAFAWHVLRAKIIETGERYEAECQRRSDRARKAAEDRHRREHARA